MIKSPSLALITMVAFMILTSIMMMTLIALPTDAFIPMSSKFPRPRPTGVDAFANKCVSSINGSNGKLTLTKMSMNASGSQGRESEIRKKVCHMSY